MVLATKTSSGRWEEGREGRGDVKCLFSPLGSEGLGLASVKSAQLPATVHTANAGGHPPQESGNISVDSTVEGGSGQGAEWAKGLALRGWAPEFGSP